MAVSSSGEMAIDQRLTPKLIFRIYNGTKGADAQALLIRNNATTGIFVDVRPTHIELHHSLLIIV
jgi:hypothetical protein